MIEHYRREISVAAAILLVAAVLAVLAPQFFTLENQTDLLLNNMPVLIVALGMTLIILTGHIDISVGSQFAICGVAAGVISKAGLPSPAVCIAVCLLGAVLGGMNGSLVAYFRLPSIVVTLAAMVALRDALRWSTEGAWIQDLPPGFQWFGLSQTGSQLVTFAAAGILVICAHWSMRNLAAGRAVYATGSNPDAARLVGFDPRHIVFGVFTATGALTGFAAFLNAARFNQIPSNAGIGLELQVIAAVVVGGTAITGGRGTLPGTVLGVVLLGIIGPALTFLGVSAYWEKAIQGAIILAAVAIDSIRLRTGRNAGNIAAQSA